MSTKQQQFSSSSSISTQIFFYFRIIFIYYFLAIQKLDAYPNFYNNELLPMQNMRKFLSQGGGEEKNEGENNGNLNNLKEENKLNDGNHPVFFGRFRNF